MKSIKAILIIIFLIFIFSLIRGFVYSKSDAPTTDESSIPLETNPRCIAINPFTDQAVVVGERPDSVSILDLNTQEIISIIPIGKRPRGVAIDNELNLALVVGDPLHLHLRHHRHHHPPTLSVIDLNTHKIIETIPVGKSPEGIAVDEESHIALVANNGDDSVSVIDLGTYRILRTIPVDDGPKDIAIDPVLQIALVGNEKGNKVSVIDLERYEVAGHVPVSKHARSISINPETHLAAVTHDNSITVINLQNGRTHSIHVDQRPIDVEINPLDNCALVLCDWERSFLRIDLDNNKVVDRYKLNKHSRAVAVNPFTNLAAVVDDKADSVTLIQLPNPVPQIASITPEAALRGGSAVRLKIQGSGFIKTSIVSFLPATPLQADFEDNHHMEVSVPQSFLTRAGIYQIVVTNPAPEGGSSNVYDFRVENPTPAISRLDPSETMAGTQGLTLTVNGAGFLDNTIIFINGVPRGFSLMSRTKLQLPLAAADLEVGAFLEVTAFNPPPGGGRSNPSSLTVKNPIPSLTSIRPLSVNAGSPGPTLTLTGDNFVKTSVLSFNNQQYSIRYINKNQVEATIPSDAIKTAGNYAVRVINPSPGGGETLPLAFNVMASLPGGQPEGSFGENYQDLVPADATVKSYDPKRFSLITGLVRTVGGSTAIDVSINILGHLEYGAVKTDSQGKFSIPAEGGGILIVVYRKEGLLTTQRQVYVPWNDIAIAETVVMVPQDGGATTLSFDGNPGTVVAHQSSMVTDDRGSRSSTLVFTGDNRAYSVDISGQVIQELTTITTRATEFTTEESMPAKLPPNSAYTYCVELSVDGAQRVRFDKPVTLWIDNFLGFPVGERVPVGYYDRDRGLWVPSDNGVVVRLLDTDGDGIVDGLDANGDGLPDDLKDNGSFKDEVLGLGDPYKYPPGSTFWRVQVTHFSPWDCNWPYGPPADAISPNPKGVPDADQQKKEEDDCKQSMNSFVEERSRIFHEDIPIPGTDMTLHYASSRVKGFLNRITVPASGENLPASLKRIVVQVDIAGRSFEQVLDTLPNQKAEFLWDGLDHLGKRVNGVANAQIKIGFVYDGIYLSPGNFAQAFAQAGREVTGIQARQEAISWKRDNLLIRAGGKGSVIAEGWTISPHHSVRPMDLATLYKGDGTINRNNVSIIDTAAGNGWGYDYGDGKPATEGTIVPSSIAIDALGNLHVGECFNVNYLYYCRVRKVDGSGMISTVVGKSYGFSGDGGPANLAGLEGASGLAIDPLGNLYISGGHRIRKVDVTGIITTVAGNGIGGYSGDGGPATQAQLNGVTQIALDAAGNLYILDSNNFRIRKVDGNGIITTVAGKGGTWTSNIVDGRPATEVDLGLVRDMALDLSGNLYIPDLSYCRIRKVDTRGIITTVAGNNCWTGNDGEGIPATQAILNYPDGLAVDAAGNLYIALGSNNRIRKVDVYGLITTIAGNGISGNRGFGGDGGPATEAQLNYPSRIALDPSGNLYISDSQNYRIRKVGLPSTFARYMTLGDLPFAEQGGLGYILTIAGRHKATIDLDRGRTLYSFDYDQKDSLISITDRFGNKMIISRDGNGTPTSITSPDGITTTFTIDSNNHLTRITYPDGNSYNFEYTPDGLMTAKTEPKGNRFEQSFDSIGRLTDVTDQEGGRWNYSRQVYENGDILIQRQTAANNLVSYLDHTDSAGAYSSTITDPSGSMTTFTRSVDGLSAHKSLSCGMDLDFKYDVDSQYKFQFVKEMNESTPAGLKKNTLREKTYQDTNSDKVPDLITEKVTVNAKATTLLSDTTQSKKILTSPTGRTITDFYDPATLLTNRFSIPSLFEADFGYDSRGRLTSIKTDTRQTAFGYDAQGNLSSITDPENHTTNYTYDLVGRMTGVLLPDGSSISFTYDKNGNMTVLTNPSMINHGFGYNRVNRNTSYQTPISSSYSYLFDRDRRPLQINFPSGKQIQYVYDGDRLIQTQTPDGNINLTYLCGSKVGSITDGLEAITYEYDGSFVTSETLSGTLNQSLSYSYNNDFRPTGLTYAAGFVPYSYDDDGLLTRAGNYSISRNAGNGLPEVVSGGVLNLTSTFNGYGEMDHQEFSINGLSLTSWDLTRDNAGRIISKAETINGVASNYTYTYDSTGRLLTVTKDGSLVEEYRYGANGTRIYEMNAFKGASGRTLSYSDEDHLLSAGDTTYQYDADGLLTTKSQGAKVTRYNYSSHGELLSIRLPDGRFIEYIHDPLGRRIAKRVDGVITEKYLWQGLTRLLAVYDMSDNLIMRFEYGDGRMPVAMTKVGTTYYLTYDQVGSLRVVADASGTVVKRIDYDSFGSIINDTNPGFAVPFSFAGGLHDRDTGLIRFGYRDYDPDIGRWTAKDPILFYGGDADVYGYVQNNPINYRDPIGLFAFPYHGVITLAAGLAEGKGWESFKLAWDSMMTDWRSQSSMYWDTNVHAMAGYDPEITGYQRPEQAILAAMQRVADEKACGRHGSAMHTLQDVMAPWHAGWEWRGNNPFTNWDAIGHWTYDVLPVYGLYDAYQASRRYLQQAR